MKPIIVVGGNEKQISYTMFPKLERLGFSPKSVIYRKSKERKRSIAIPPDTTAVLALTDLMSHSMFFNLREDAAAKGVPFASITRNWSKTLEILRSHGLISEDEYRKATENQPEKDDTMQIQTIAATSGMTLADIALHHPSRYKKIVEDRPNVIRLMIKKVPKLAHDLQTLNEKVKNLGYGGVDPRTFKSIKLEMGLAVGPTPTERRKQTEKRTEVARNLLKQGRYVDDYRGLVKYMTKELNLGAGVNPSTFHRLKVELGIEKPIMEHIASLASKSKETAPAPAEKKPVAELVPAEQVDATFARQEVMDLLAPVKAAMRKYRIKSILMTDEGKIDINREELRPVEVNETFEL